MSRGSATAIPDRAAVMPVIGEQQEAPRQSDDAAQISVLIARARAADLDAFERLYRRFQPYIARYLRYRLGSQEVARDLAQEVFVEAWQLMPRYQERDQPFSLWLYRIALRLAANRSCSGPAQAGEQANRSAPAFRLQYGTSTGAPALVGAD